MAKPTNIETSYGIFPTLIHFENYWEEKVSHAFKNGFDEGRKYFKRENLHKGVGDNIRGRR